MHRLARSRFVNCGCISCRRSEATCMSAHSEEIDNQEPRCGYEQDSSMTVRHEAKYRSETVTCMGLTQD